MSVARFVDSAPGATEERDLDVGTVIAQVACMATRQARTRRLVMGTSLIWAASLVGADAGAQSPDKSPTELPVAPEEPPAAQGAPENEDPCAATCELTGHCVEQDGHCITTSAEMCQEAVGCEEEGRCTPWYGRCVVGSHQDCGQSAACEDDGRCVAHDYRCIAPAPPPPASTWDNFRPDPECLEECAEHGRCNVRMGECVATFAGCRQSEVCRKAGRCDVFEGKCRAGSSMDCRQSRKCQDGGECFYDAKERSCEDTKERKSTGLMVGGIVMMGTGAAAAILSGVFYAVSSIGCGFERGNCDGPGYGIVAGIGGGVALLGIPFIVVGASKVSRRHGDDWAPKVGVGPGAFSLEWSF